MRAVFPGVDGLLGAVDDAWVAIAVVTSNSEANVLRVLGADGAARVRYWACRASVLGKAGTLRRVLRANGVPAHRAVRVGDEIRDLHAAHTAVMAFYAVGWGYTHAAALARHAPDALFRDVAALRAARTLRAGAA